MTSETHTTEPSEQESRRAVLPGPSPSWVLWGWLGGLALSIGIWVVLVMVLVD